jgi:hypothetical protein
MPQEKKRVKMWSLGWLAVLGLMSVLASPGCTDSADGDPAAALASCNLFCDGYLAAGCADYDSLEECKSIECSDLPGQPVGCQTQVKIYYDCRQAQVDICINPDESTEDCFAELDDLLTCSSA